MDPLLHIMLPVLLLLALRMEPRTVLLLSPLAIAPDLDALFGLHRAALHNLFVTVALPLAVIVYSWLSRPEWMQRALLAQFFLASHVVLDLAGVSVLWPLKTEMLFLEPEITFNLQGGVNFGFKFVWGWREFEEMGTTSFLSGEGFALLFLIALLAVVFRREALFGFKKALSVLSEALKGLTGR